MGIVVDARGREVYEKEEKLESILTTTAAYKGGRKAS
jgi:hypothetical protein